MRCGSLVIVLVAVAACGGGGGSDPDGGGGGDGGGGSDGAHSDATPIPGDFTCAGTAWPTSAPDPLALTGRVTDPTTGSNVGNGAVEIRKRADDTVVAMGAASGTGVFAVNLATGGVAPAIYRKVTTAGHVDAAAFDPFAIHAAEFAARGIAQPTPAGRDAYYATASLTSDPGRGTVLVEILDCAGLPVRGATASAPGATRAVYYDDFGTMLDPAATATQSGGTVMLLGVPAGSADITITAGVVTYRAWPVRSLAGGFTSSTRYP